MLCYKRIGIFDDNEAVFPSVLEDVIFIGKYNHAISPQTPILIAIGNNVVRYKLSQEITHPFATLLHPKAILSPSACIEPGTVILAGAVVQARSVIGCHNIINANAVIDHDVTTGACVHIRPQAYIGSDSTLSDYLTISPCQVVEHYSKL